MERVLVVIMSETRTSELTFNSVKEHVIDRLNADVCVCIGVKQNYNYDDPYYKIAKHRFLYDESNDSNFVNSIAFSNNLIDKSNQYEKLDGINFLNAKIPHPHYSDENHKYLGDYDDIDNFPFHDYPEFDSFVHHKPTHADAFARQLYGIKYAANNWASQPNVVTYVKRKNYMEFLNLKHHIEYDTGDRNTFSNFSISTYIHIFFKWFLQQNLKENNLLAQYDRFIIMRSDYIFKLPLPSLSLLDRDKIWIPDGEDYDGICDRFAVVSNKNIMSFISILESFHLKSNKYYHKISCNYNWNMEKIHKMHLQESGLFHLVRRFPFVMYSVRNHNGTTRWVGGTFIEQLGYYVKYPFEFQTATKHYNTFNNLNINIDNYYKSIIRA